MTTPTISTTVQDFATSLPEGSRVLDVGCGTRPYERFFARCDYVGVDVEASGRKAEQKRAHLYFNGVDLPFEDARFDAVLCTEVLEHATDAGRLTKEIRRVLKPGRRVLITVPFMWGEHEAPYDFRRFSSYGVKRLLDEAGMHVEHSGKLMCGIDAINALVQSEICNFDNHHLDGPSSLLRRAGATLASQVWAVQLRLWRRLYRFERIYIDNFIVGRTPG